jgi:hypothetical protein
MESLPGDCIGVIFSYLTCKSLGNVAQTSQWLNRAALANGVWHSRFENDFQTYLTFPGYVVHQFCLAELNFVFVFGLFGTAFDNYSCYMYAVSGVQFALIGAKHNRGTQFTKGAPKPCWDRPSTWRALNGSINSLVTYPVTRGSGISSK